MGISQTKLTANKSTDLIPKTLTDLQLTIETLKYENISLKREVDTRKRETKKLQQLLSKINPVTSTRNYKKVDFSDSGSIDTVEGLRERLKVMEEALWQQTTAMEFMKQNLHEVIKKKYVECETQKQTIDKLKQCLILLHTRLQSSQKTNERPTSQERRLIEVMDTCNSSKIFLESNENLNKLLENDWTCNPKELVTVNSENEMPGAAVNAATTSSEVDTSTSAATPLNLQENTVKHVNVT